MRQFTDILIDIVAGRIEPASWLAWWESHAAEVEDACRKAGRPGWYVRLKPGAVDDGNLVRATLKSQEGACYVLNALGVHVEKSKRYWREWHAGLEAYIAQEETRRVERAKEYAPILAGLQEEFPKCGRWLRRIVGQIDQLALPVSEAQLFETEQLLGLHLPAEWKRFLRCTAALSLEGLQIGLDRTYIIKPAAGVMLPIDGMLCFGEYWLEADGDNVLFDLRPGTGDDPPVVYYSHEAPRQKVRTVATSFTRWLEALPRSPMFRPN